jgi:hypothetical protein
MGVDLGPGFSAIPADPILQSLPRHRGWHCRGTMKLHTCMAPHGYAEITKAVAGVDGIVWDI